MYYNQLKPSSIDAVKSWMQLLHYCAVVASKGHVKLCRSKAVDCKCEWLHTLPSYKVRNTRQADLLTFSSMKNLRLVFVPACLSVTAAA